jgi:CIC family chloride channel protein
LSESDPGQLLENTLFSDFRHSPLALLLFVGAAMLLKAFATGLTLGSGGNGGNFAPSLFLGLMPVSFSKSLNLTGSPNYR